jgi:hypothetical protein
MFADTDAIRALGSANSTHADDLFRIAITLSLLPVAAAGGSLGRVGAEFLSALTEAAADGSREAAAIGDHLGMSNMTVHTVASAYDSVDSGAAVRIAGA